MTLTPLEQVLGLLTALAVGMWGKPLLSALVSALFSRRTASSAATGAGNATTTATGTTVTVNTGIKTPSLPPDSPSPSQLDKELTRAAARAAGFSPGRTGEFAKFNTLGAMRCDGHLLIVKTQEDILTEVRATRTETKEEMRAARKEAKEQLDRIETALSADGKATARIEVRLDSAEKDIGRHEERLNER